MIRPGEIQQLAGKNKVRDKQIEKDYILSWVLYGFSREKDLKENLVFKGGTALKKIYFPDYRYSEDLDFTLLNDNLSDESIFHEVQKSFDFIQQEANILLQIIKDHKHESGSINFYIGYSGPLGGTMGNKKLKVDITRKEQIEFDVLKKPVFADYSDLKNEKIQIKSYQLQEILIEKMAALMGRTQPRDFYDLWYLLDVEQMDISDHLMEFERKAKYKGHNPKDFVSKVAEKEKIFKARWEGSLQDQINELPDFEDVIRGLKKHFRKL